MGSKNDPLVLVIRSGPGFIGSHLVDELLIGGSAVGRSLNDLLLIPTARCGRTPRIEYEIERLYEVKHTFLSKNERTGWQPSISLEDGVFETVCWIQQMEGVSRLYKVHQEHISR